ncbi:hypothetical protein ACA910_008434 [Epithemia clementina (nom. ined.)]
MASRREEIQQLKDDMPDIIENLTNIRETSDINCKEDPREPTELQKSDLRSIHFDLSKATNDERGQSGRFLTADFRRRRMDSAGTLEQRQERLRTQLVAEYNLIALLQTVEDWNNSKQLRR